MIKHGTLNGLKFGFIVVLAVCWLAGCGSGGEDDASAQNSAQNDSTGSSSDVGTPSQGSQQDLTISGKPLNEALPGLKYSFAPSAKDANGDTLTYAINKRPAWASFDTATGEISGTPTDADVATYDDITITVSDGHQHTAQLGPFSIAVVQAGDGSASLSWTAPTQRTDGSALPASEIQGYNIYWGNIEGSYPKEAHVDAGQMDYVVEGLIPGTWYFVATAVDTSGIESQFSNVASKVVN